MKILKKTMSKVREVFAELKLMNAINQNTNTFFRLGGEKMDVTYSLDAENPNNSYYIVKISSIDYIENNIYKKTSKTYQIPLSKVHNSFNFSIADVETLFANYLYDVIEIYVDSKNRVIDYIPKTETTSKKI